MSASVRVIALMTSRLMELIIMPAESERKSVLQVTSIERENAVPLTPPIIMGNASSGIAASNP